MAQPQAKIPTFKRVDLFRLDAPYPPIHEKVGQKKTKGFYMAETTDIQTLWEKHLEIAPLSDTRTDERPPIHVLDPAKLKYDVKEGENVKFYDKLTQKLVAVVVQNMVDDKEVVRAINGGILDHLNRVNKMMRREDPGRMGSVGYTSGRRDRKEFIWGRNMKEQQTTEEHHHKISCCFAHIWTLAKQILPNEVCKDYEVAIGKLDGISMDAGAYGKWEGALGYKFIQNGAEKIYQTKDLAPPSGTCGKNYCRYTHCEKNLNKYCVSWTSNRSDPTEAGGNFYIASYGIRIPGRSDQLVVWQGEDFHGTTLPNVTPLDEEPSFNQSGMAFILSAELKKALARSKQKLKDGEQSFTIIPQYSGDTVLLDDSNVVATPRATLRVINQQPDTGTKAYAKDYIEKFEFPSADHAYAKMTRYEMLEIIEHRNGNGHGDQIQYGKSWSVDKLRATLLIDDGVKVQCSKVPKKGKQEGNKSAGNVDIDGGENQRFNRDEGIGEYMDVDETTDEQMVVEDKKNNDEDGSEFEPESDSEYETE